MALSSTGAFAPAGRTFGRGVFLASAGTRHDGLRHEQIASAGGFGLDFQSGVAWFISRMVKSEGPTLTRMDWAKVTFLGSPTGSRVGDIVGLRHRGRAERHPAGTTLQL